MRRAERDFDHLVLGGKAVSALRKENVSRAKSETRVRWQRRRMAAVKKRAVKAVGAKGAPAFGPPARGKVKPGVREEVIARDGYVCRYCSCAVHVGEGQSLRRLTIDHVIPSSRGGRSRTPNLVVACWLCNARKGDRTPAEMGWTTPVLDGRKVRRRKFRPDETYDSGTTWRPFEGLDELMASASEGAAR